MTPKQQIPSIADLMAEQDVCQATQEHHRRFRDELPAAVDAIVASCRTVPHVAHVEAALIPSKDEVTGLIELMRDLVFPGFFGRQEVDWASLPYHVGQEATELFDRLSLQVSRSIRHECRRTESLCSHCLETGQRQALEFLKAIPTVRELVSGDVVAAYRGDPAAKSYDEVVFSYPGLYAVSVYRLAHALHRLGVPVLPRMMAEHAHGATGIDIHPGASIGREFFIDHGTGVVIGETCEIGDRVTLYQGVTLGALSFVRDEGGLLVRGTKRHPTIEDDVVIYSGATILGGHTVIGRGCVIGGNVWLTESVPPQTKVTHEAPRLVYRHNQE
ncbi:MAG: serine O-acetyltransferase EpsC [Deferrisomatales bacterium]|nr:serine O-acetyltransferase EpsC [Deferrisomatales bacterium]